MKFPGETLSGSNQDNRAILEDILRMATNAANNAARAAAKVDLAEKAIANLEHDMGRLAGEVGDLSRKIGRWPDGPDDGGQGILGALAKRSPSMVDEEERNRSASPTQSIAKPTVPPAVRNAFKRHPILSGVASAVVTGVSIAWAVFEVLAIVGK